MPERENEIGVYSPFDEDPKVFKVFDEAGEALEKKEVFEKEFDQEQTTKLMWGFVNGIVQKQQADASLETMNVKIEEDKGNISGTIRS